MRAAKRRLQSITHLLATHRQLLSVILGSLLSVALLAARLVASPDNLFTFMGWNLFLAWLPFLIALSAQRLHRLHPNHWLLLLVLGLLWLVFFPNAPYLITDLWHLRERPPIPLWFDLGMLSAFALTGIFLAVFSLHIMQRLVRQYTGRLLSWAFVGAVLFLGGLGIYLGRFLRWNSWDILLHPEAVVADLVARLASPLTYPGTYGVTLVFAALLFVCYLAVTPREPAA
jgi:uncharacterized membrane protein